MKWFFLEVIDFEFFRIGIGIWIKGVELCSLNYILILFFWLEKCLYDNLL